MKNIRQLDYNKIDEIFANAKIIKTNKKVSYYNLACSFDIETTSMTMQDKKVAFMYIWQFGIEDLTIYGRTWQEFQDLLMYIHMKAKLNDKKILICYIHNMSFEFQFIMKLFNWENVFAVADRKPIKALTSLGIEFRDSYILSGYSLAKVAENLQYHKIKKLVGYLDYTKIRTYKTTLTEKELAYCEYDVIIVIDYIKEQIKEFGDITKIPLTNTGRVRTFVRNKCYYTSKNHRKTDINKYRRYRSLMNELTLDLPTYIRLKKAFQGGFTHSNSRRTNQVLKNVASVDFTSSYPAVMVSEKYPMSKPFNLKYNKNSFNEDMKKYNMIFDVEFYGLISKIPFENYLSESKCTELKNPIINNGRIFSSEHLKTTITEVDFSIIRQCYEWQDIKITNIQAFYKNYLPKPIIESIISLYQDKTQLKGVSDKKVEYMRSKGMLNSTYGMCVTDIIQQQYTYDNESWVNNVEDYDKQIEKYNNNKKRFLYYPWGVFITAYARRNLWTGILECKNDYCYSDTDSIKILNYDKHKSYIDKYNKMITNKVKKVCEYYELPSESLRPKTIKGVVKQIGVWDYEGVYTRFKTLGAKRYLTEQDGKLHITVAGLSKNNGLKYMLEKCNNDFSKVFEMFNDDLYIPADKTGKMTHIYIDQPFEFNCLDFQGHESHIKTLSGVHLSNCEFTLSIAKQYGKFLKMMHSGYVYKGEEQRL